jgi:hypothetical protein
MWRWLGDAVTVEVEDLLGHGFQASVDPGQFARENISCWHGEHGFPEGHWEVNPNPRPALSCTLRLPHPAEPADQGEPRHGVRGKLRVPRATEGQRPRDLGWANSSHWMEEEI